MSDASGAYGQWTTITKVTSLSVSLSDWVMQGHGGSVEPDMWVAECRRHDDYRYVDDNCKGGSSGLLEAVGLVRRVSLYMCLFSSLASIYN